MLLTIVAYTRREAAARNRALEELARSNAELKARLAERTIERDDVARDEALIELARTNEELITRLAQRTIERDDLARDEALVELTRTNTELKMRLAERTIERDDVARDDALVELTRTNVVQAHLEQEFDREHRASAAFQRAALPTRLPDTPGVQLGAIYRAAKAEALVGGDWYDAFRLSDGRIALSIGDVMGNGLSAAVTMGAVRQALRGAAQILADPVAILDAADRALHSEQPGAIVTAFVGIYDPLSFVLTYASAGHPPALVRDPRGDVRPLPGTGLPLGLRSMDPGPPEPSHTIAVADRSLIVLYTDGLIESTRDISEGEERLNTVVARTEVWKAENPAAAIADQVLDDVVDDVAVLTIRINSEADVTTATVAIIASSGSPFQPLVPTAAEVGPPQ